VFRRRREVDETDAVDAVDDVDDVDAVAEDGPTTGPWDPADLPQDDSTVRVELGGVSIPVVDRVEVRVEVVEDVVVAAALADGASQLVVNAFAAPKSAGIWAEVRQEITDSLRNGGGAAEQVDGPFGPELRARIPNDTGGHEQARFIGVDGPRWFLRGLITGPAATDPSQAARLESVFRDIVVVRGGEAMAPRDPLPLHLPREIVEQTAAADQAAEPEDRRLQLQERGPEITEIQ
jgi:hypothetical protein